MLNRSLIGARHKSPAVEWALYPKGGSEPLTSSPRSEFTTLSLISSNEVCGEHDIAPRLIQDLRENFTGRCWSRSPREIVSFQNSGKVQKVLLPNWVHRRPFRQSLAGIFGNFELLAFHCHRSQNWQIGRTEKLPGLFTGHDPTRGSGQGVFKISRVESGRVKRFSKSRGSGRVMTREIRVTRGSSHHDPRVIFG